MKVTHKTLKTGFSYRLIDSCWAVSAQPQPEDFKDFKDQGFTQVINVRGVQELEKLSFDISETVRGLGFQYHHIPVIKEGGLDKKALDQIHQILYSANEGETGGEKTIIHCAAGQRAAVALLVHLLQSGKMSASSAAPVAFDMGLQKEELIFKVLEVAGEKQ